MPIVLSIDIGTTKICAIAYDADLKDILSVCAVENNSQISGLSGNAFEQSPKIIIESVFSLIKSLSQSSAFDFNEVSAVAVTGQMHGVVLVDDKYHPVSNLIIWRDMRASHIADKIGEKYADSNGCGLRAGYGGATLSLLAAEGKLKSSYKALTISDYLCGVLSGVFATEPTHAASWGIYDIKKSCWNSDLVAELSIPCEILPEIKPTSAPLRKIMTPLAEQLGLCRDVVIYSPIGDNQAAFIGAVEGAGNSAVLNLGTGGQISIPQRDAVYIEGFETRPMPDGGFIMVAASLCGGWTYAYLKDFFKAAASWLCSVELSDGEIYQKMDALLDGEGRFNDGLCLSPYFCGTRTSPSLRGAITNINTNNLTPKALVNSFAQAMVAELADAVPVRFHKNFSSIRASGNAVRKNPAILKIAERCFNKPVFSARLREEAAAGAAIAACKGGEG